MNHIVQYLAEHGYSVLFASVFANQLGLPVPAISFSSRLERSQAPGTLVHVRLVSPLSSANAHCDAPLRAVVWEPLFSPDRTLILPEGARAIYCEP